GLTQGEMQGNGFDLEPVIVAQLAERAQPSESLRWWLPPATPALLPVSGEETRGERRGNDDRDLVLSGDGPCGNHQPVVEDVGPPPQHRGLEPSGTQCVKRTLCIGCGESDVVDQSPLAEF